MCTAVSASRSQQPPGSSQLHLGLMCWSKQLKYPHSQGMACNSAWWLVLKSCSVNSSSSAIALQRALLPSPPRTWASALRSLHHPERRKEGKSKPTSNIFLGKHVQNESNFVIFTGSQPYDFVPGIWKGDTLKDVIFPLDMEPHTDFIMAYLIKCHATGSSGFRGLFW